MTAISHKQARRYIQSDLDGRLNEHEHALLEEHLKGCEACRLYSAELSGVAQHLQQALQARWNPQDRQRRLLVEKIVGQRRRIIRSSQLRSGVRLFITLAAIGLFALASSYTINRLLPKPEGIQPLSSIPATTVPTPAGTISSRATMRSTLPLATVEPTATPIPPYNGLIVFVSEASGNPQIYSLRLDGSGIIQLTKGPARNYSPAWSPDGERLAFVSERNGNMVLSSMNPDGSGLTQLTDQSGFSGDFAWSPDGRKIAYLASPAKDPNSDVQIFVMDANGSAKTELVDMNEAGKFLGWSPDSRQIIYSVGVQETGAENSLYIINADGTGRLELASPIAPVDLIHWQDARHFFLTTNNDIKQIYRFSTDGTAPVPIASISSPDTGNPLPAPNLLAWYDQGPNLIYIISMNGNWTWYRIEGTNKTYLAAWSNSVGKCQASQDNWSGNMPSPDHTRGFVDVFCSKEGVSWFYLASADGAQITPLLQGPTPMRDLEAEWSPNGQYMLIDIGDNSTARADLYLLDIEKALKDHTTGLVRLTNDSAWKYGIAWQPRP
ncbi:MAG TPA: zf-HC2 domain-containing protein [Anaerolineales bacterium]|nr:zf-HC2 domain-containing protein [Anaerolineales bacterium]